jgi:hypothetical protein
VIGYASSILVFMALGLRGVFCVKLKTVRSSLTENGLLKGKSLLVVSRR